MSAVSSSSPPSHQSNLQDDRGEHLQLQTSQSTPTQTQQSPETPQSNHFDSQSPNSSSSSGDSNNKYKTSTKVVLATNLPFGCTPAELKQITQVFGRVEDTLMLSTKRSAFIQMENRKVASDMIVYYKKHPPTIRGHTIYFNNSNYETLVKPDSNSADQNKILLVSIHNMKFNITVDIIHQVFVPYGKIDKIVSFQASAGFQVLIQFNQVAHAVAAREALDGKNIYTGCCTLHIQYSKYRTELTVKYNDSKSRDYTNPNLPPRPNADQQLLTNLENNSKQPFTLNRGNNSNGSAEDSPVLKLSNLNEKFVTTDILFNLFGGYGNVCRVKILFHKRDTALIQFQYPSHAQKAVDYLNGIPFFGKTLQVNRSRHGNVNQHRPGSDQVEANLNKDYRNSPLHRFTANFSDRNALNIARPSTTLLVSNLPPNFSEDDVRKLFSNYGAINAIEHHPQEGYCLVNYEQLFRAVYGLVYVENYRITPQSKPIRVIFSKTVLSPQKNLKLAGTEGVRTEFLNNDNEPRYSHPYYFNSKIPFLQFRITITPNVSATVYFAKLLESKTNCVKLPLFSSNKKHLLGSQTSASVIVGVQKLIAPTTLYSIAVEVKSLKTKGASVTGDPYFRLNRIWGDDLRTCVYISSVKPRSLSHVYEEFTIDDALLCNNQIENKFEIAFYDSDSGSSDDIFGVAHFTPKALLSNNNQPSAFVDLIDVRSQKKNKKRGEVRIVSFKKVGPASLKAPYSTSVL